MPKLTNAVVYPDDLKRIIEALRLRYNPRDSRLAQQLEDNGTADKDSKLYAQAAKEGLDEAEFDFDDTPAVSHGDDPGAYVQIWRWIPCAALHSK